MAMGKKILFVVDTSYQLFYTALLSHFFSKKGLQVYLVLAPYNEDLIKISRKIEWIEHVFIFNRYHYKNNKHQFFKEIIFARKSLKKIIYLDIDYIFIYKDSGYIQSYFLEKLRNYNGCKCILIEEGLSLYTNQKKALTELSSIKRLKQVVRIKLMGLLGAKNVKYGFGYNPLLSMVLCFKPEKFKQKNQDVSVCSLPLSLPSSKVLNNVNNVFFTKKVSSELVEDNSFSFMYIGQPLSELGMVCLDDELKLLESIDNIFGRFNLRLLIKPHPVEKIDKYNGLKNVTIIKEAYMPVELLLPKFKINSVLTPFSSAADNLKHFYEVDVIYLYKLIGLEVSIITESYGHIPNSLIQLENDLVTLCDNPQKNISQCDVDYENLIDSIVEELNDNNS